MLLVSAVVLSSYQHCRSDIRSSATVFVTFFGMIPTIVFMPEWVLGYSGCRRDSDRHFLCRWCPFHKANTIVTASSSTTVAAFTTRPMGMPALTENLFCWSLHRCHSYSCCQSLLRDSNSAISAILNLQSPIYCSLSCICQHKYKSRCSRTTTVANASPIVITMAAILTLLRPLLTLAVLLMLRWHL